MRIIDCLKIKPQNKNQLAKTLNLDYNTITHHINIMQNHNYIREEIFDKCKYYHLTDKFYKWKHEYNIIKENMDNLQTKSGKR